MEYSRFTRPKYKAFEVKIDWGPSKEHEEEILTRNLSWLELSNCLETQNLRIASIDFQLFKNP
jgi:hypothetical protein